MMFEALGLKGKRAFANPLKPVRAYPRRNALTLAQAHQRAIPCACLCARAACGRGSCVRVFECVQPPGYVEEPLEQPMMPPPTPPAAPPKMPPPSAPRQQPAMYAAAKP